MKRFSECPLLRSFFLFFVLSAVVYSQTDSEKLFKDARALNLKALSAAANIFSKDDFEKASDFLSDAESLFKNNGSFQEIQQNLNSATVFFNKAIEKTNTVSSGFTDLLKIRQLAINSGGNNTAPSIWKDGEENFSSAIDDFNDKDMEGYQKYSKAAESNYKDAELSGIKGKYLSDLKASIAQAEDKDLNKYAPITLGKSKKMAQDLETLLDANRYDTVKARSIRETALYELNHGLYLEDLFKKMKDKDNTWEDLVLMWEDPLIKISTAAKVKPTLDKGFNDMSTNIVANINADHATIEKITAQNENLNKELTDYKAKFSEADDLSKKLTAENETLKKSLDDANKLIDGYKLKFAQLESENTKYKTQSDVLEKNSILVDSVSHLFLPSEAEVIKNGDLITIRLLSIDFPLGKSTLEPQYFNLLVKVQKAIQLFPNQTTVIEGHTDGRGDYKKNIEISQQRAIAVYQYLMANMGAEASKITTNGLGGTKPIANNSTEEGRAKNRRIEVVIDPHFGTGK